MLIHQKDWNVYLPYVTFAYNTSLHSSTNEIPFYLMHGRDPVLLIQLKLGQIDFETLPVQDYRRQLVSKLQEAFEVSNYVHEKQCQLTEVSKSPTRQNSNLYVVGDLIWLYSPKHKLCIETDCAHQQCV